MKRFRQFANKNLNYRHLRFRYKQNMFKVMINKLKKILRDQFSLKMMT